MILEGNERSYGAELARHLLNACDNDHVTLHTIEGFVADDLFGAFAEAEAISGATRCKKYLFSLSLNPPIGVDVSVAEFEAAVVQAEDRLGLSGQPRAIVFHEKNGRRHAHAVWSRVNGQRLKAINISHYKRKLTGLSHDIFMTHGWDMPAGLRDAKQRDPLNYSRHEAGQAKRQQRDPKAMKAMFRACWETSDSKAGFEAALKEQGFALACGDRRGFVAVDAVGKVWSLSRWCGVKAKEMRGRLGSEADLQSVHDIAQVTRGLPKPSHKLKTDPPNAIFEARRATLVAAQRAERKALLIAQETQRRLDIQDRQASLPKGLRGLLARATGQYQANVARIEADAKTAEARNNAARHALVRQHIEQRQELTRAVRAQGLTPVFQNKAQSDPDQTLILRDDGPPYSKDALIKSPDLAVHHLSQTKATFKRVDLLRVLAQRIDEPQVLQKVADQAMQSASLVRLPDEGTMPVFTTQDYQDAARNLDQSAQAMAYNDGFGVRQAHVQHAIASQNAQMRRDFGGQLSTEQRDALHHVLGCKQLSSVVGLAGAGKSTLLATEVPLDL